MKGGDFVNKSEMLEMYLREDVEKAKESYLRWKESYNFYLNLDKSSQGLITYYRRETEVALAIWQYKLSCLNKKFKLNPIEEEE